MMYLRLSIVAALLALVATCALQGEYKAQAKSPVKIQDRLPVTYTILSPVKMRSSGTLYLIEPGALLSI